MIIGIYCREDISQARLRYTLAFLTAHPLAQSVQWQWLLNPKPEQVDIKIHYGRPPAGVDPDYIIPVLGAAFQHDNASDSFCLQPYHYENSTVYGLSKKAIVQPLPLLRDRHFQLDIFESIFFHISRYEEVFSDPAERDPSGWLREEAHLLVRSGLETIPVVDHLVAVLLSICSGTTVARPTTFDLSHDVDFLFRFDTFYKKMRALAGAVLRKEPAVSQLLRYYRQMAKGEVRDPYDTFDWLLSDAAHWTQKTLYLLAGGNTPYDRPYPLDHPQIDRLLTAAMSKGYRVGLHPSYNAAFEQELFRIELQRLESRIGHSIQHSRQHWLRFDWSITPAIISSLQIREDASLGYRRRLGFRCGTGFPYPLYDFVQDRPYKWTERPLIIMDSAALHQSDREQRPVSDLLTEFLDQNQQWTHLSMNFHNSNFDPLLATGSELSRWYRSGQIHLPG